jgi:hypothetical protein
MTPRYREGWNDRVRKTTDDYGKVYRTRGGHWGGMGSAVVSWTEEEREDYARGWIDASAKIATLVLE